MTTKIRRSFLKSGFGAAILSLSLLVAVVPASAATPQASGGFTATPVAPMTQDQWASIKAELNASSLSRIETVSGGTRTFTYTLASGSTLVLSEPESGQSDWASGDLAQPNIYFGDCGWFQLCVFLNRADQSALAAGAFAGIAASLCFLGGPVVCVGAWIVAAAAASYISSYGFCSNLLQVGVVPFVGFTRCV